MAGVSWTTRAMAALALTLAALPALAWEEATPEQLGMSEARLRQAREFAQRAGGSGCILRGGKLVMAWGDQRRRYDLYSTTKSIAGTALLLALADKKVRLNDRARDLLPDFGVPPDANRERGWLNEVTLFHLATHTAGFEKTRGWCRQLDKPGTSWCYSDGGTNWLADCLTAVYGRDLFDLMTERVFEPLGIRVTRDQDGPGDLWWGFNSLDRPRELKGIPRRPLNAGIFANVDAMARIGYLFLRRGEWEGRRILPAALVDQAQRTPARIASLPVRVDPSYAINWGSAPRHYGLLWWNNADGAMRGVPRDAFFAWGLHESLIVVVPSLDLVVARAGERGFPSGGSGTNYDVIEPFLRPICESVALGAPYPPSRVITSLAWEPADSILCLARNADNWPITWADDGHQYTAYGDGWGFAKEHPEERKLSLGFCRITGDPPNVTGEYIPSDGEQKGGGASGKKASGLLMVDGTLYMWVRNAAPGTGEQSQLAWSSNRARTWRWADWRFPEFGYPCFLNFGLNYRGARDGYVYVYSPDTPSAYRETDRVVLLRVPKSRIRERSAYQFFKGLDALGRPVWTSDIEERGAVFTFPGGCNRMDVTYNAGISRYLMVMRSRPGMSADAGVPSRKSPHAVNHFSIYEAPEPWGPWTTVYYSEQWEGKPLESLLYWQGWGESAHLPSKWMSADGRRVHLLFSGGPGGFSIRAAALMLAPSARER